ncbi:GNAT family N-acetyltransferase [Pseudonocardia asaccharolytica]|uniref:GNAT family N-acetyltransferase n=1 Tax=Pseudonocardia asaccharolytica DSM 44247 = NBRC 16224 TaxID=1123024 RepID=A0A511D727_9PSEU|nr:GNAT family N-acetyltransferase [Pseudonocardia asaccharolytica]GEL19404.1 GNAT family N-acetyltransferase [Pseudonocardia asaccharolytica DSM 44247 = NBRC 16224]
MSWHVAGITLDNLDDLPKRCRSCVFWELSSHLGEQAAEFGSTDLEKEAWVSGVLLEWGSCGKIVYVRGEPAGYVMYAPPSAVPRTAEMPTGPVSADAVLLTTMQVRPEFAGEGLGRMLAQAVVKDLTRRGVKAIEVFGDARPGTEPGCVIPAKFLRHVGFKTVRPHPRWPRLRMELRAALTWKEDVEAALEQIFGSVTIPMQASAPTESSVPVR